MMNRFLAITLLIGSLVMIGVAASAAAPTRASDSPANGMPAGVTGLPSNVEAELMALPPGESQLLAFKPAGSSTWSEPASAVVTTGGAELTSTASTTVPGSSAPGSGLIHAPMRRLDDVYGCTSDAYPPGYTAPDVIQGLEDLTACVDLSETDATVCMKDSRTYGLHSCADNQAFGDDDFTAWSDGFVCQSYTREWQTTGTNLYTSTEGAQSLWGFSSFWGGAFTC